MIDCICPIPQRLQMGSILSGATMCSAYVPEAKRDVQLISGRSIRVVPLKFYKVFSQWGTKRYEHTFVTDEEFNPLIPNQHWNNVTKQTDYSNMSSILIPISVKRIDHNGGSTFLFSRGIDYLLTHYRPNLAFSEYTVFPPNDGMGTGGIEVPINGILSNGVQSYAKFQQHIFDDFLLSKYGELHIPEYMQLLLTSLTPELPWRVSSCVDEILEYNLNGDSLYHYIDDMYAYSSGEHMDPFEFYQEYLYDDNPLDPITLQCVRSPSYILATSLCPYFGDIQTMRAYANIGYNHQVDKFTSNVIDFPINAAHQLMNRYDFIESLLTIPDTDFKLDVTWDTYIPEYYSYFGFKSDLGYLKLHDICKQLFLNRWSDKCSFDRVVISKNWHDDVYVYCEGKNGPMTYYFNLAWFHLVSPSLVNNVFFFKR